MLLDLSADGKSITLKAPTTAAITARQIPGSRHNAKEQLWYYPLSWATCVTARGIIGPEMQVGQALNEWAARELTNRINPALELREAKDAPVSWAYAIDRIENSAEREDARIAASPLRLRPDQRAGSAFLAVAGSALDGDEMRLGKTVTMIRALQLIHQYQEGTETFPILIVTPNGVKRPWRSLFRAWWPEARVLVPKNGTVHVRKGIAAVETGEYDVLILNYEALTAVSKLAFYAGARRETCSNCDPLSTRAPTRCQTEPKELNAVGWKIVIADEVHKAVNPSKNLWTRALWALGDKADRRYGLTGSPPENPDDQWAVMRFVYPDEYPAKGTYRDRYVQTEMNLFSGYEVGVKYRPDTREELDRFMLPRFIRRTRKGVFPDDLEPFYLPRYTTLTGKQLTAYNSMKKDMLAQVDNGVIFTTNPLTKLLRLQQFASAYATLSDDGKVLLSEPSSKLDEFEAALAELGDEQLVVFAKSKQLIAMAAARLEKNHPNRSFARIVGGVSPEDRALSVDLFQEGKLDILLLTIAAGGEGLTLSAADTALFLQREWSRILDTQAKARIELPGVGKQTTIIDIITEDTVDERVLEALADKDVQFEDLVHDAEMLRKWLS